MYVGEVPAVPKVSESCLKEEVKVCLRQELQQYLIGIEEMNSHFKQILEDNVKKMEEMISLRMSQDEGTRVTNSHVDRETAA